MKEETKVAVLGAGVTGLCVAHYLAQDIGRESVLVLEASDAPGGTSRTDHVDGFALDWGPNGFLDREPRTLEWVRDLGIDNELLRADASAAHRFVVKKGRLVEVVPPPRFMLTKLLSLRGRARIACEPFIRPKRDNTPESVWDFAARRIGREAADMLVSPMVTGIFAGDARVLSLAHCFPRMAAMEQQYGGLVKALIAKRRKGEAVSPLGPRGVLTTFRQGAGFLACVAAAHLVDRIRYGEKVLRIAHTGRAYGIETSTGLVVNAEAVVVALPAHAAAEAAAALDPALTRALASIPYADVAVVCTAYAREHVGHDLNGFGFVAPRNQGLRVLGCLWTSSLFPNQAPQGCVLLRTMYGGYADAEAVRLSDCALLDLLVREVHPLLRISCQPSLLRVYRHAPGIPQYLLHHEAVLEEIAAAEVRHPGVVFAGNAYRGVGLNDCVLSAARAREQLRCMRLQ